MRKAVASPLLSAFVMPGVGQLYNGQVRKAGLMVSASSMIFLIFFALLTMKLWAALTTLDMAPKDLSLPMAVMHRIAAQGLGWLLIMALIGLPLWLYGIIDAYINGRKVDAGQDLAAPEEA